MKTTVIDFYSGFEGEPEMRFVRRTADDEEFVVRIWIGFFHYIMDSVEPSVNGWKGLALTYHTCQGWYEESPWKIDDIHEVFGEWMLLDSGKIDNYALPVWKAIGDLLRDAKNALEDVWIFYDQMVPRRSSSLKIVVA